MTNKLSQKGGDKSLQMQIGAVVVGIDEKRVREIFDEKFALRKQEYSEEALALATTRVKEFEECLISKISAIEKGLMAFADPSFQFLLVEAQKSAASTERPIDYDLLSELLINRIQNGEDRKIRAGISRAVEIVGDVSDDALLGLTVFHSIEKFIPSSGDINKGLDCLDNFFCKIIYGELPDGKDWLNHLDILDALRVNRFGGLNSLEKIYSIILDGYVAVGIKKDSEEYNKALEIIHKTKLNPAGILVQHVLNNDYVRLEISQKNMIDIQEINEINDTQVTTRPITHLEKEALKAVYQLYEKNSMLEEHNIKKFMSEWNKRPNLKILREWWDNLPSLHIEITSVGEVLAHANAQRCDNNLPPLNSCRIQ